MGNGDWFGIIALTISAVTLVAGFLAKPHFASHSQVESLREENRSLREETRSLREDNKDLVASRNALRMECEFWRDRYREAQGQPTAKPRSDY